MKLLFLYGLPASGKLTVAQELASLTGYKVFHNHLAVDLLLSVFEFGSPAFVRLREEIWLSVFAEACGSGVPGLIFTFAPERTVRPEFPAKVVETVMRLGGQVEFVELLCPLPELMARLDDPSRAKYQKLTSRELFTQLHGEGCFEDSYLPEAQVCVDTSVHGPSEAAGMIVAALELASH